MKNKKDVENKILDLYEDLNVISQAMEDIRIVKDKLQDKQRIISSKLENTIIEDLQIKFDLIHSKIMALDWVLEDKYQVLKEDFDSETIKPKTFEDVLTSTSNEEVADSSVKPKSRIRKKWSDLEDKNLKHEYLNDFVGLGRSFKSVRDFIKVFARENSRNYNGVKQRLNMLIKPNKRDKYELVRNFNLGLK